MKSLLKDLKSSDTTQKIFDQWSNDSNLLSYSSDNFKFLISEVSVCFNVDFDGFKFKRNHEGLVDWEEFKRELIQFCKKGKENVQEKPEKLAGEAVEDTVESVLEIEFREGLEKAALEGMMMKQIGKKGGSWLTPYLQEYFQEVLELFSEFDKGKTGVISGNLLTALIKKLMGLFSIQISDKDLFLFERLIENRHKNSLSSNRIQRFSSLRLTYSQCINLIEEWAQKESYKQITTKSQITKTISQYEHLTKTTENFPKLKDQLSSLVSDLNSLKIKPQKSTPSLQELQTRGLQTIFRFYSKQLKMVGQTPTFSHLSSHQTILNLSKFTKFCIDFDISSSRHEKNKIPLKHLSNIFTKATNCERMMSFQQFVNAIDLLADAFYGEDYDFYYHERLSGLNIEEKRSRLLVYLHCDDPGSYLQKLKGFGQAFSIEKQGYRIPDYDLSKKYKYKDQSKIKAKIESWKQQKNQVEPPSRSKSVPSHARLKAIQQSILMRPDRVTWDLLSKNSNFINKDDLAKLLDADDIKDLVKSGVKFL